MTCRLYLTLAFLITLCNNLAQAQPPIPFQHDTYWGYKSPQTDSILIDNLSFVTSFKSNVGIVSKANKWGAVTAEMKLIIPFKYDDLKFLLPNVIQAKFKNYYILFDSLGKKIVKHKLYDAAVLTNTTRLTIKNKAGNYAVIQDNGTFITPYKFASPPTHLFDNDLLVTEKKDNLFYCGVINEFGNQLIPNRYLFIKTFNQKYYRCQDITNTVTYYDLDGKEVYKAGTEKIYFLDTNAIIITHDTSQTLVLKSNQAKFYAEEWRSANSYYYGKINSEQTRFVYPDGESFIREGTWYIESEMDGMALVNGPNGNGLVDEKGQFLVKPTYKRILSWNNQMAIVIEHGKKDTRSIVSIESGKTLFTGNYGLIDFLPCHQFITKKGDSTALLNHNFQIVQADYSSSTHYYIPSNIKRKLRRSFFYKSNGKQAVLSNDVKPMNCDEININTEKFDNYELLTDNYGNNPLQNRIKIRTRATYGQRMGLLDFEGKTIIPINYAVVSSHQDNYIPVAITDTVDGKPKRTWGILDLNGHTIIPPTYDKIDRITKGVAFTVLNEEYSMLNLNSKKIIASGYTNIRYFVNDLVIVTKDKKYGLLNLKGEVIAEPIYEQINYEKQKAMYTVKRNGQLFQLDMSGNEYPIK